MYPSLNWETEYLKCWPPTVIPTWVAMTLTKSILNYLADNFAKEHGVDLRADKMALQRLKEAAEKAKKELSSSQTTNINLPFITVNGRRPSPHE